MVVGAPGRLRRVRAAETRAHRPPLILGSRASGGPRKPRLVRANRRAKGRARRARTLGYRLVGPAAYRRSAGAANGPLFAQVERADDLAIPLQARALQVVEQ